MKSIMMKYLAATALSFLIIVLTSASVMSQRDTSTTNQPVKTQAEVQLEKTLAEQQAIAVERTSTNFYYPTGSSVNINPPCGKWLGRDAANGGCYITGKYHIGVDIVAPQNSAVYAIADGEIILVSSGPTSGWTSGSTTNIGVFVKHRRADGTYFLALYGHIFPTGTINGQSKQLAVGDRIVAGQAFAEVGDWNGDGDHLHYGVVPSTAIPSTGGGRGWGMMANSLWDDPNTFVNPIQFIQTQSPWGSNTSTGSFGLVATPITLTITQGESVSFVAEVKSNGGFNGTVRLQALNLPNGYDTGGTYWTNEYVSPPVNGRAFSTLVIGTSDRTVPGTYTVTVKGTSGSATRQTFVQVVVKMMPAPIVSGFNWTTTPRNNKTFSGTVRGAYFASSGTRVFFCRTLTSSCYEHPSAGVRVNSSSKLTLSGVKLTTGSWQLYVRTASGSSSRSGSFYVSN